MSDQGYMCADCLWRGKMSMAEWMQHSGLYPTHLLAHNFETEEKIKEENELEEILKD